MVKSKITVAKYIEQQLALCGKSQREVALELGYANANIMTMLKAGTTKLPINKVGILAKSLNVDPTYLLKLVMGEYMPETWETIESILGAESFATDQDRMLATFSREVTHGVPIDLSIDENRKVLGDALKSIASRDQAKADAAVKRVDATPKSMRGR